MNLARARIKISQNSVRRDGGYLVDLIAHVATGVATNPFLCAGALDFRAGAGDENRTHVSSLGSSCSTIELHPQEKKQGSSFVRLEELSTGDSLARRKIV